MINIQYYLKIESRVNIMEDRDWEIIHTLNKEKNITKTAQLMYMSQPALTSRLRQIEQEFGVKLVHRSTKGIQFTPEGDLLSDFAEEIIAKMNQIKNQVKNFSHKNSGTIVIAASNYLTLYTLPSLLQSFKEKYPLVNFKVITDWTKNVFSLIYSQKAHIGFASVDYGGFKNIHCLYEEPICITYNKPFKLEDLPDMPRITYQSDYLIQAQLDKWWREHFSVPPKISMQVDKLVNCKEMITHGLGYAMLPERIIGDIDDLYKIYITNSDGQKIIRKTWMFHNEKTETTPIVQLFLDFIKEQKF